MKPEMRDRKPSLNPRAGSPSPMGSVATPAPKVSVPRGPIETGWLADLVYTGEKFEAGLAFFADAQGRITRFSRDPADLAMAKRLSGQAVLPGLVNAHSHSFHRVLRGRTEQRARHGQDAWAPWREMHDRAVSRLSAEDVYDTARMAFMEMLLAGITCVAEFHYLHRQPDGSPWAEPNALAREILRAAHELGIRIALLNVAYARAGFGQPATPEIARFVIATSDQFMRETDVLRTFVAKNLVADDAWVGVAPYNVATVPLDYLKAISNYAHAQRMRLHLHLSERATEVAACVAEYGRTPVALLSEHGVIDKRVTLVHAIQLTDEEIKIIGSARACVCVCPNAERNFGYGAAPLEKLLAAGTGLALGTDGHGQINLLEDARNLEYRLRSERQSRAVLGPEGAATLFHAATVAGARSLGAPGGALEVGRPADFFTINLFDPSVVGADPASLLANVVFALERRAIRDVWVGARQRIANGRHVLHGMITSRFVEVQQRLWATP